MLWNSFHIIHNTRAIAHVSISRHDTIDNQEELSNLFRNSVGIPTLLPFFEPSNSKFSI
jgi:hypothetical protein